jgi:hypothetical protein
MREHAERAVAMSMDWDLVREGTVYPIRPFLDPGKLFPSAGQAQLACYGPRDLLD